MQKRDIVPRSRPRALEPIAWAMAVLLATAVLVQLTHRGIDVLLALTAGFILLALERTLGDWIAESVGEPATVLLFTLVALIVVAYATTRAGQSKIQHFLTAADAEGIRPLILEGDRFSTEPFPSAAVGGATGSSSSPSPTGSRASARTSSGAAAATTGMVDGAAPSPDRAIHLGLSATPEVVATGEAVTLRAVVQGRRTAGAWALFTINGEVIAKVAFDAAGIASTTFTPAVPGFYTARFRVSPGSFFSQNVTATFNVVPGR